MPSLLMYVHQESPKEVTVTPYCDFLGWGRDYNVYLGSVVYKLLVSGISFLDGGAIINMSTLVFNKC